jgi:hypothetical protein
MCQAAAAGASENGASASPGELLSKMPNSSAATADWLHTLLCFAFAARRPPRFRHVGDSQVAHRLIAIGEINDQPSE